MCAPDRFHPGLRQAKVPYFTFLNQVLHGSRNVFNRHIRVNTMLIEQVDGIGPEALERGLGDLLDVLGATVQPGLFAAVWIKFETELRCNLHLLTHGSEGFAHEFFVGEWTVHLGGIEECDAAFDRRPDHGDHLLLVSSRTVTKAHSHTAEPESRNFQATVSKFALLHCFSFASRFS